MPHDHLPCRARRPIGRRLLAVVLAVALTSVGTASADDDKSLEGLPDPIVFARDGVIFEELLDQTGLGAAWRASIGLGDVTRALTVSYVGDSSEPATDLVTTVVQLENITAAHDRVVRDLRAIADDLALATEEERDALIVRNRADAHLEGVEALLGAVAVQLFEGAFGADDEILGLDGQAQMTGLRNVEITSHTLDEMIARRGAAEIALAEAEAGLIAAAVRTRMLTAEHGRLDDEAADLSRDRARLDGDARSLIPDAASAFALAGVGSEPGLTVRALDAYIRAEEATTLAQPTCAITWRTVAAVAAVESSHGTYQGRALDIDGRSDRPIVGLRLDGDGVDNYGSQLASIPDTDGGRWDGDPAFDRAIGPLQFIPESWSRWARDNDDDGETDPYDIDDAALATAAYLCNYGSHRSWDAWKAAIFGYNHSVDYVASVKGAFDRMQRLRVPVPDGARMQPAAPNGTYVPLPAPEEEIEEPPPGTGPPDAAPTTTPPTTPPTTAPPTTVPPTTTSEPPAST